ncbi:hypothetical protein IG631_16260 [Alternaria alternata]|nr:hypothetical protein IG631_16260 [Alternaria alternata]
MDSTRGVRWRRATFSNGARLVLASRLDTLKRSLALHKPTIGGPTCQSCSGRTRVHVPTSRKAGL